MRLIDADELMNMSEYFGCKPTVDNPFAEGVNAVRDEYIENAPTILEFPDCVEEYIKDLSPDEMAQIVETIIYIIKNFDGETTSAIFDIFKIASNSEFMAKLLNNEY